MAATPGAPQPVEVRTTFQPGRRGLFRQRADVEIARRVAVFVFRLAESVRQRDAAQPLEVVERAAVVSIEITRRLVVGVGRRDDIAGAEIENRAGGKRLAGAEIAGRVGRGRGHTRGEGESVAVDAVAERIGVGSLGDLTVAVPNFTQIA